MEGLIDGCLEFGAFLGAAWRFREALPADD
jgi:hypothetical protein